MTICIIQRTWQVEDEPEITQHLFRIDAEEAAKYPHIQAIYLNTEPPAILMGTRSQEPTKERTPFKEYLSQFDPKSLFDYAYVLDTYRLRVFQRSEQEQLGGELIPTFESLGPCVDEILASSHGILLWHHQLEQMYLLCELDQSAALQFRKGILAKKQTVFQQGENLIVSQGLTLTEVIDQRMIYYLTTPINLYGARFLLAYDC